MGISLFSNKRKEKIGLELLENNYKAEKFKNKMSKFIYFGMAVTSIGVAIKIWTPILNSGYIFIKNIIMNKKNK